MGLVGMELCNQDPSGLRWRVCFQGSGKWMRSFWPSSLGKPALRGRSQSSLQHEISTKTHPDRRRGSPPCAGRTAELSAVIESPLNPQQSCSQKWLTVIHVWFTPWPGFKTFIEATSTPSACKALPPAPHLPAGCMVDPSEALSRLSPSAASLRADQPYAKMEN